MVLETQEEKERGYSDATHALIAEISRVNLRQEPIWDITKIKSVLREIHCLCGLQLWRIVECQSPFYTNFAGAAEAARAARAAQAAWTAEAAEAAWAARAARAAWAAGAAGAAGAAEAAGAAWTAEAAWVDFYFCSFVHEHEFLRHERGNENDKRALHLYLLFFEAKKAGLGYMIDFNDNLYLAPNPVVRLDAGNEFHCDDGPAIMWPGAHAFYSLHGVKMSLEEHGLDDPKKIVSVKNAEVRAALIRRMGIERVLTHLPHKRLGGVHRIGPNEYELLSVKLSEQIHDARYLKMKNPSVPGVWHIEGVHPTCETVEHALNWRNTGDIHKSWTPEVLT